MQFSIYLFQEAAEKLKEAETERFILEERLKLKRMKSSVRLARPLSKRDPGSFVTHRGAGAFHESEFQRQDSSEEILEEPTEQPVQERQSADVSEMTVAAKSLTL